MAVRRRLSGLSSAYSAIQARRAALFNWKWRVFVILLTLSVMFIVREYLDWKYFHVFATESLGAFLLADKLFYWFMTGLFFGVISLALLYEGELILGLWKGVKHFEELLLRKKPAAKRRKRKKKK